jgi:adenylate cyclase
MKCGRCQFDVSVGFAFCPGCGLKLAGRSGAHAVAAAATDRRSATVLFADLSGFTAISERLDPEDVRRLQTDLFAALRGVIDRFDGYPEKFVGDAVVAVFGAPVAHEDDPQRALRAALEMHERAGRAQRALARPARRSARAAHRRQHRSRRRRASRRVRRCRVRSDRATP